MKMTNDLIVKMYEEYTIKQKGTDRKMKKEMDYVILDNGEMMYVKDMYVVCYSCDKKLNVGSSIQYTTSGYTTYCDNIECTEGVATIGTCLEDCWWG